MLIAQVTDTHIKTRGRLAYRKVDSARALVRCVTHLNALQPRPDLTLITGDLVDTGALEEYRLLRELLEPLESPFHLIPGNHDRRENLRAVFSDHRYLFQDADFLHYALDDHPLRLIGLDTVIAGAKEGTLCERRLSWLARRLEEQPERPTLLFMHHPPFITGIEHMDVQNLQGAEVFGTLIKRHAQIVKILCGHVHRSVETLWCGVPVSIGPSSSHAVALDLRPDGPPAFVLEPPACGLHQWGAANSHGNGLVSHLSFIGAFDGPHPFFEADGRLID